MGVLPSLILIITLLANLSELFPNERGAYLAASRIVSGNRRAPDELGSLQDRTLRAGGRTLRFEHFTITLDDDGNLIQLASGEPFPHEVLANLLLGGGSLAEDRQLPPLTSGKAIEPMLRPLQKPGVDFRFAFWHDKWRQVAMFEQVSNGLALGVAPLSYVKFAQGDIVEVVVAPLAATRHPGYRTLSADTLRGAILLQYLRGRPAGTQPVMDLGYRLLSPIDFAWRIDGYAGLFKKVVPPHPDLGTSERVGYSMMVGCQLITVDARFANVLCHLAGPDGKTEPPDTGSPWAVWPNATRAGTMIRTRRSGSPTHRILLMRGGEVLAAGFDVRSGVIQIETSFGSRYFLPNSRMLDAIEAAIRKCPVKL